MYINIYVINRLPFSTLPRTVNDRCLLWDGPNLHKWKPYRKPILPLRYDDDDDDDEYDSAVNKEDDAKNIGIMEQSQQVVGDSYIELDITPTVLMSDSSSSSSSSSSIDASDGCPTETRTTDDNILIIN